MLVYLLQLPSPQRSRKLKFAIAILFDTTEEQKENSNRLVCKCLIHVQIFPFQNQLRVNRFENAHVVFFCSLLTSRPMKIGDCYLLV